MWPQVIKTRDGLSMVSYLTLPASADKDGDGEADAPVPMVLLVHGGPWARDTFGYSANHQWLANRGYAVLSVNYRGSTGFGKNFLDASRQQWAAAMHDDLIDAVEWAVAEGVTRPDQVAIMGGSYGGYATLVGLTFTPERFACGVDIVGPSNLVTLLNSIPPYWASVLDEFARNIGDPRTEEGRELLMSRSPISRVDAIQRPLLIAQGANDPRVKQAESDQIVEAMQQKGLPVTYVLFPDEGHGFARAENSLAFYGITEAFISACLGGDYEPLGDALEGSSTTVPAGAEHIPGLEAALEGFTPEVRK
jgi:dipeptidyl aminopeptidase/acylaminoacyl peptidase